MLTIRSTLTGGFDAYAQTLEPRLAEAVATTAESLRRKAQAKAARRTGAMAASVYVSPSPAVGTSDYAAAAGTAHGLNPRAEILDEQTAPVGLAAIVAAAAAHGLYVDRGTARMSPQPWFTPATDETRPVLTAAVTKALQADA